MPTYGMMSVTQDPYPVRAMNLFELKMRFELVVAELEGRREGGVVPDLDGDMELVSTDRLREARELYLREINRRRENFRAKRAARYRNKVQAERRAAKAAADALLTPEHKEKRRKWREQGARYRERQRAAKAAEKVR